MIEHENINYVISMQEFKMKIVLFSWQQNSCFFVKYILFIYKGEQFQNSTIPKRFRKEKI